MPQLTLHVLLLYLVILYSFGLFRGRKALNEACELISTRLQGAPLLLTFKGLGTFGSKVVFANVADGLKDLEIVAGKQLLYTCIRL